MLVYLYYDSKAKKLCLYDNPRGLAGKTMPDCTWKNIESVNSDRERGQVCAHTISNGIVAEFPIDSTVLTCQRPENE